MCADIESCQLPHVLFLGNKEILKYSFMQVIVALKETLKLSFTSRHLVHSCAEAGDLITLLALCKQEDKE